MPPKWGGVSTVSYYCKIIGEELSVSHVKGMASWKTELLLSLKAWAGVTVQRGREEALQAGKEACSPRGGRTYLI